MANYGAPDWLLEMSQAPSLEDDTPQAREDRLQAQLKARQDQADMMEAQSIFRNERNAEKMALRRAQAEKVIDEGRPKRPNDFGPMKPRPIHEYKPTMDFEPANPTPPPPSPFGPALSAPDMATPGIQAARGMLPMPEDSPENDHLAGNPAAEIRILSEISGMPPDQVAAMALLGREISRIEEHEKSLGLPVGTGVGRPSIPNPPPTPTPPPAGPLPAPPAPVAPSPISGVAPVSPGALAVPPPGPAPAPMPDEGPTPFLPE